MFRCEECKKVSRPHGKAHKKVVQTRPSRYLSDTVGFEIVKERTICTPCLTGKSWEELDAIEEQKQVDNMIREEAEARRQAKQKKQAVA